jgi:hypothetical protein
VTHRATACRFLPLGVRVLRLCASALLLAAVLAACTEARPDSGGEPVPVDPVEVPQLGACRVLTPQDVAQRYDSTPAVDCADPHTAETFAIGPLPDTFVDAAYDDERLGRFAYRTCGDAFARFLGADESSVLRTPLSWAWFRPAPRAWEQGARWYRCDVVGGGEQDEEYVELPVTARGLLGGRPDDRWVVCAVGPVVSGSEKVACSQPHDWRAVTTIKLGDADDAYPGSRLVEVRTRDFCSRSVGAWLGYPLDFDFGYTWFGEGEWEAGNRRSICWAKTDQ